MIFKPNCVEKYVCIYLLITFMLVFTYCKCEIIFKVESRRGNEVIVCVFALNTFSLNESEYLISSVVTQTLTR